MTIIDVHQAFQFAVGVMLWALAVALIMRSRAIAQGKLDKPSPLITLLFGLFLAVWAVRQSYWNIRYLVAEINPAVASRMADAPVFAIVCSIAALVIGAGILTIAARPTIGQHTPAIVSGGVIAVVIVGFIIARG